MLSKSGTIRAVKVLHAGGLIAYPTEAVYGLGCDPLQADAVARLLCLKRRHWRKGLILVASDMAQIMPYIQPLPKAQWQQLQTTWPGPVTWLLPAQAWVPRWLRGHHQGIAVRVSAHPMVRALCDALGGAIVSTSANRSRRRPARTAIQTRYWLRGEPLWHQWPHYCLPGAVGDSVRPTIIRDIRTGELLRS